MWIPPEDIDPIVLHAPTRKKTAFFGAVCVRDGRFTTQKAETFNADTFQIFLHHLLRRYRRGRKMVVVVDNARWHHSKKLKPWLHEHRKVLRLDFLPPYSPELNFIERVWKLTRYLCTHNHYFDSLEELINIVENQFTLWKKPNNTLQRLCAIT
jgi:transposase